MMWLVKRAICALMPRTDGLPGAEDTELSEWIVRYRRETNFITWLGVVLGAIVFAITPLMTIGVPLPAFLLPEGLREKHAQRITKTNIYLIRQSVFVVKLAGGLCWGSHPMVRRIMNLTPYPEDPGTFRDA